MSSPDATRLTARRLRRFRIVAWIDVVLLAALLTASFTDARDAVSVLGPVHGANVLALVALSVTGALDRVWGWWLPAVVVLTGGPLGALVGERIIGRRLRSATLTAHAEPDAPTSPVRTPLPLRP